MSNLKKGLVSAIVIGAVAAVGGGTWASFNAQTKNPSSVATGTIVLGDTVNTGTECLSWNTTTNAPATAACDNLWSDSNVEPGATGSAIVTVKNEGSLTGNGFKVYADGTCTDAAINGSYHGTGSLCGEIQMAVEQGSYSGGTFTPASCVYGTANGAGTACTLDATHTLADFGANHATYASNGISVNSGSLTSGSSSYFRILYSFPSTADNSFQGRSAGLSVDWQVTQ